MTELFPFILSLPNGHTTSHATEDLAKAEAEAWHGGPLDWTRCSDGHLYCPGTEDDDWFSICEEENVV